MIGWKIFFQISLMFWIIVMLFYSDGREVLLESGKRAFIFITSKRFIVLMIATYFVYKGIRIDPNWLWLAGFFIGIDTMQNNKVFTAFADFIRTNKLINKSSK